MVESRRLPQINPEEIIDLTKTTSAPPLADEDDEEEDDFDLTFKDEIPQPKLGKPGGAPTEYQLELLQTDPALKEHLATPGVHFVISNMYLKTASIETDEFKQKYSVYAGDDILFSINDFQPHHKLSELKKFTVKKEIQDAEKLCYFFKGMKLRNEMTLKDIQVQLQQNDLGSPVTVYAREVTFDNFSARQIKDHFGLLYLQHDTKFYDDRVVKQRIEFEREKLRKLKEVYAIAVERTNNCRFFVRDLVEYVKKVLQLQLNVTKLSQEEKLLCREKGFSSGKVEGALLQKIEGIERTLFVMSVTEPGTEPLALATEELELKLLQTIIPLQILNNKYRKELRKTYDISEEFEEELMNNKMYGCLTDGNTWVFVLYEHSHFSVKTSIVRQLSLDTKNFFVSLHEVVKTVVCLTADLIFNKCNK